MRICLGYNAVVSAKWYNGREHQPFFSFLKRVKFQDVQLELQGLVLSRSGFNPGDKPGGVGYKAATHVSHSRKT